MIYDIRIPQLTRGIFEMRFGSSYFLLITQVYDTSLEHGYNENTENQNHLNKETGITAERF